jgi:cell division protein FtsQ
VRRTTRSDWRGPAPAEPRRRPGCRTVLFVLMLGGLAYVVFASPLFVIRQIDWNGPESLRGLAEEAVPMGGSLFAFRTAAVVAALREQPIVADVRVTRVPPGTLRFVVTPRTPYVRVRLAGGEYVADRGGVIFADAGEQPTVPLLMGAEVAAISDWRIPDDVLGVAVRWLEAAPRYSLPAVVKVDYRGDGRANLALANGKLLKVGSVEDADRKLAAAEALLKSAPADTEYLDLELAELPVIGRRHAALAESAESSPESAPRASGKANGGHARKQGAAGPH